MVQRPSGQWNDLRQRVLSAAVMVACAAVAIWVGGPLLLLGVAALAGVAMWELWLMAQPGRQNTGLRLAIGTALLVGALGWSFGHLRPFEELLFIIAPGVLAAIATRPVEGGLPRRVIVIYATLIVFVSWGLVALRADGVNELLFLISVVVVSDSLGYFCGRMIGGPKFWPRISPSKTWSGTIGGWVGAAVVGLVFSPWLGLAVIPIAVILAFAAQIGDMVESAIKRRTGVKDSSDLIPGHGGVLDRIDGMIAVVALYLIIRLAISLMQGQGFA
ncbi:phosphatidate cytidylyltransferase [Ketogulonicigenium vulgare]|uniref:Phosphatidate cytidylyltransferase n=1 Tax=Ketogulonicigenium vulgare (strain WSH-001) TaxID=759362 RepID=F9Y6E0_KETVW|nr:phosphatidate cytidylyltransferase [Ketogulonicigenium vulgare]ADO42693.1 phosphatidate cytidylyltransferase [Ketogulonicigenium vulgare Y25]AEM40886.1 Phosphatidate cytidylyltransferase [Ketogulonicigenium vulgare WSH-001]ALJ81042.1 phosphatidate cytidylyltransferase [Ketogulonicigenium vulgare]ANW33797.1 phosphatidate cytidylyltransferase [Ketogulonicigenium vulgare]AOZ54603.1 phosphatidate cytidylyltransferase [Ketogulonicigenium vulgare]